MSAKLEGFNASDFAHGGKMLNVLGRWVVVKIAFAVLRKLKAHVECFNGGKVSGIPSGSKSAFAIERLTD